MTYNAFVEAIAARKGIDPDILRKGRRTFALNTNQRGKNFVARMRSSGIGLKGKNVLDVGCAYGGMSIEPARMGARVIGIDVDEGLLELARINARDDVDVTFLNCDASSVDFHDHVPENWADVIIINDVLEHIYDTGALLENLARASRRGCLLYFVVPNGMSTRFVSSEGHKKVFAISVIDPDCWHYFIDGRPRIFYRRWAYFEALLCHYGFGPFSDFTAYATTPADVDAFLADAADRISRELETARFRSDDAAQIARHDVGKYLRELEADRTRLPPPVLLHKYCADFWSGIRRMR